MNRSGYVIATLLGGLTLVGEPIRDAAAWGAGHLVTSVGVPIASAGFFIDGGMLFGCLGVGALALASIKPHSAEPKRVEA